MKKIFYSILLSGMMVLSACDALDLSPEDYYAYSGGTDKYD